ncbi:hypothetical protein CP532_0817 [Ophiocordyceps camponoti-leonardi (nom. inval.)]|nr:hypothetical protein CP532_0817 [Ophiocordyceps camponoti-leonardi (nom. inval.)]
MTDDLIDSSLSEPVAEMQPNEPRLFSRTCLQRLDASTPPDPYIIFTTTPGKPQHLIVKIWSHESQGGSEFGFNVTNDDYTNFSTYFGFGPIEKTIQGQEITRSCKGMYRLVTNVRGSSSLQCLTSEWKIGVPIEEEDEDDETDQFKEFLESLTQEPSREVGIFAAAEGLWENSVWKMEVQMKPCKDDDGWQTVCGDGITTLRRSSRYLTTTRSVGPEEESSLRRQCEVGDDPANPLFRQRLFEALGSGRPDKYEKAIYESRRAIDATPLDHPNRAQWLHELGYALTVRFSVRAAMEDLEQAIVMTREALAGYPLDHPDRWNVLCNLGHQLAIRYNRARVMKDVDEAVDLLRQSVKAAPSGVQSEPPMHLWFLVNALSWRFSRTGEIEDLDEAVEMGRQAVAAPGPNDQLRRAFVASATGSLAQCLADYHEHTGDLKHLDEAIDLTRQAASESEPDSPLQSRLYGYLGDFLIRRFSRTQVIEDHHRSMSCYKLALYSGGLEGLEPRISAGRRLLSSQNILQHGPQSYENAVVAVMLIPTAAYDIISAPDMKFMLSQAMGIASNAAASALHYDKGPLAAVQLLETGRGILGSSISDLRTDISELQKKHPTLADLFNEFQRRLDAPTSEFISGIVGSSSETDQRHFAARQMPKLLRRIRTKDGFKKFLMPPIFDDGWNEAAASGPIVIINVSVHRCDALIIEESGIRALKLHNLTLKAIMDRVQKLRSVEVLEWLWDDVVDPILEALGFTGPPSEGSWPHIWWIPTGPLSRFPLHAAGYHLSGGHRTALDRVVSSYSSSVRTIMRTRRRPSWNPSLKTDGSVAVVSMKDTPSLNPLIHTDDEISTIRALCSSAPLSLSVISPQPYRDETLAALKTCGIFHFAGHGNAEADPLQSRLCLQDWENKPLTVKGLIETDLSSSSPFLAYLSACGTGNNPDRRSADESIHLTSVFQLTGFRHVIGTLWEVDDHLCVDMARIVYESLGANGLDDASVGLALHQATRELRQKWLSEERAEASRRDVTLTSEKVFKEPLWAPYVHFGV